MDRLPWSHYKTDLRRCIATPDTSITPRGHKHAIHLHAHYYWFESDSPALKDHHVAEQLGGVVSDLFADLLPALPLFAAQLCHSNTVRGKAIKVVWPPERFWEDVKSKLPDDYNARISRVE